MLNTKVPRAHFRSPPSYPPGANLQALLDLSSTTTVKEAKDKLSTLSATGRAAIALGIQALTVSGAGVAADRLSSGTAR